MQSIFLKRIAPLFVGLAIIIGIVPGTMFASSADAAAQALADTLNNSFKTSGADATVSGTNVNVSGEFVIPDSPDASLGVVDGVTLNINSGGILTIQNTHVSAPLGVDINGGTMIVKTGGRVDILTSSSGQRGIDIRNGGTLEVQGGTVNINNDGNNTTGIMMTGNSTMTVMLNGIVNINNTGNYGITVNGDGSKIEVSSGSLNVSNDGSSVGGIGLFNSSKILATGGSINVDNTFGFGIHAESSASIKLEAGYNGVTMTLNGNDTPLDLNDDIEVIGENSSNAKAKIINSGNADLYVGGNFYPVDSTYSGDVEANTTYVWDTNAGGANFPGWKAEIPPPDYTLFYNSIDGNLYKDSNYTIPYTEQDGKWNSSSDGSTLTFDGFVFETTANHGLYLQSNTTIVLNGENTITSTYNGGNSSYGIFCQVNLTFEGDGSLTVTGGDVDSSSSANKSCGIYSGGEVIINDCTINANGKSKLQGGNSYGIYGNNNIIIESGTVNATGGTVTGGESYGLGVAASASITITGGTVTAIGDTSALSCEYTVPNGYTYYVNTDTTPSNNPLPSVGTFTIDSDYKYAKIVTPESRTLYYRTDGKLYDAETGGKEVTDLSGWSGNGETLTLDGFEFITTAPNALVMPDGSTIVLADSSTNTLTSTFGGSGNTASNGIYAEGALTITGGDEGTGILNAESGSFTGAANNGRRSGIRAADSIGSITITGGEVNATGGGNAQAGYSYGIYAKDGDIIITGGSVKAINGNGDATSGGDYKSAIYCGTGTITISGGTVEAISEERGPAFSKAPTITGLYLCWFNTTNEDPGEDGNDEYTYSNTHRYVKIQTLPEYRTLYYSADGKLYDAETGGNEVTGLDGWSGDGATLTLNDFEFETTALIALFMPDGSTIELADGSTNTLTSTFGGSGNTVPYAIYKEGALTITGDGSLSATASLCDLGRGIYGDGTLTISGGTVTATGNTSNGHGIYSNGNITIEGGTVIAIGGSRALNSNYTVPSGYKYYVNTTAAPSNTELTGDGNTSTITNSHKYVKIEATGGNTTTNWQDTGNVGLGFGSGTGTEADPHLITNEAHLAYLAKKVNEQTDYTGKYFKLIADLDLSAHEWTPIGDIETSPFKGTFDGDGHTISGLTITETNKYAGLFGVVDAEGTVKNLGLTDVDIDVSFVGVTTRAAALVAQNSGTIINCYAIGEVTGTSDSNSAAPAGGLVGSNSGNITNCYAQVDVTQTNKAASRVGGLVGETSGGIITNCYATGSLTGSGSSSTNVGGLVGNNLGGITDGYWNTDLPQMVNGSYVVAIGVGNNSIDTSTTGMTSAEMKTADFADTLHGNKSTIVGAWGWALDSSKNNGYPYLLKEIRTLYFRPDGKLYDAETDGNLVTDLTGWSGNGATLTLDGFEFETTAAVALNMATGTTLNLTGTNTITSTYSGAIHSYGILSKGSLTIEGFGILNTTGGTTTGSNFSGGIGVNDTLNINSGTINATSGTLSGNSYGIFAVNLINITNGTVTAIGNTSALSPDYTVPNGYEYYVSTTTTPNTTKLTGDGDTTTIGSSHKYAKIAVPETRTLYFGEKNAGEGWKLYTDEELTIPYTEQMDKWTASDGILTLNNFNFTTTAATALGMMNNTTIALAEGTTNTITSTFNGTNDSFGIISYGTLKIQGSGTLNVTSGNALNAGGIKYHSNGIYVINELSINVNGTINVTAGEAGKLSVGINANALTISGSGAVNATGGNGGGGSYGINNTTFTLEGGTVTAIGGTNAVYKYYTVPNGYKYWVNETTEPSNEELTSNGTAMIQGEHKYAKIEATTGDGTTYTVTYNANGSTSGTVPTDSTEYNTDATVTVKGNTGTLVKTGYTFDGWNTKADGTGTSYTAGNTFTISTNTTLYAKWTANDNNISVTGVTLNKTTTTILSGTSTTLKVTIVPANATNKAVTWVSSDNAIATVANGVVTGVSAGTATITVTTVDGNHTAICAVTVIDGDFNEKIETSEDLPTINVDGFADMLTDADIESLEAGATVEIKLVVEAAEEPTDAPLVRAALESGTSVGFYLDLKLFKTVDNVTSLIQPPVGTKLTITIDVPEDFQNLAPYYIIRVHGDDVEILECDYDQTAQTITFETGAFSTYALVYTTIVDVTGVTLNKTIDSVNVGATTTLTATVAPENATDKSVTWSSLDTSVATVADGVVTGVSAGTATITVTTTDGGYTATCTITVLSNNNENNNDNNYSPTYLLTIISEGKGSVGGGYYFPYTLIKIKAGEKDGYVFDGWTTNNGGTFADENNAETTFKMPLSNVTVTANFKKIVDTVEDVNELEDDSDDEIEDDSEDETYEDDSEDETYEEENEDEPEDEVYEDTDDNFEEDNENNENSNNESSESNTNASNNENPKTGVNNAFALSMVIGSGLTVLVTFKAKAKKTN